ncbi:MAG: PLP-dependent aminotransferase family protein [Spirochaetes bacterium]|nr:PLP-dependent aminotransferase family protein [Spirochaetota bacterium]
MYIEIDRSLRNPIRNQLYEQLLERILKGELAPGTKMPSSRHLHEKNNISRNIIIEVYEQLSSEGYLEGKPGKGTWVAENVILGDSYRRRVQTETATEKKTKRKDLIRFNCGIPDLKQFPEKKWKRSLDYAWSLADEKMLSYPPVEGRPELRTEICDYLLLVKGIRVRPECVIITSGTSETLLLIASHFSGVARDLIIEDPVIDFAADIFNQSGYKLRGILVDESGIDTEKLPSKPAGKLIFVSPSHQFPTGCVLSAKRRVALVDYAARNGMFIIEDDYDSEFRYEGYPLRSLFLMNPEIVIHAGTFSKNMFPSLRLGYMVVPESIAPDILMTKEKIQMRTPAQIQLAAAHFMKSGAFTRNIARMKRIYKRKHSLISEKLSDAFGDDIEINSNAAGMHLNVSHKRYEFSTDDCRKFEEFGVRVDCEASYSLSGKKGGLLLGFGNVSEKEIAEGIKRLKQAVDSVIG